jgi:hypothetical protein
LIISGVSREVPIPIMVGVPTAPNDTGVLFAIRATITAAKAGKPKDSNNGATSAAGVPKPADPSINAPNSHATIIVWILRSCDIEAKPRLIVPSAPLSLSVNNKVSAPKTINIIFIAITTPLRLDARIQFRGVLQIKSTKINVTTKAKGIAFVADHLSPTIRIKIVAMGITASRARRPSVIKWIFT